MVFDLIVDGWDVLEKFDGFVDGHIEDFRNIFAAIGDFEGFAVITLAFADFARRVNIRQEMHLDLDDTVALAGFAAPAFDVEGEASGFVAAQLRFLGLGEKRADLVEGTGVGGWIGARRATDRALVDVDDLVDLICAFNGAMLAGNALILWIKSDARGLL